MPLTNTERARRAGLAAQAKLTPSSGPRPPAVPACLAVKELVDQAPEPTEAQQQRLRALLRPVPEGGGRDGA